MHMPSCPTNAKALSISSQSQSQPVGPQSTNRCSHRECCAKSPRALVEKTNKRRTVLETARGVTHDANNSPLYRAAPCGETTRENRSTENQSMPHDPGFCKGVQHTCFVFGPKKYAQRSSMVPCATSSSATRSTILLIKKRCKRWHASACAKNMDPRPRHVG